MTSPFADCGATLCREERVLSFRKESFPYEAQFYRCDKTGLEFTTTELDESNLGQVYDAYRRKYGIPSPEEIKATRKQYSLSAAKMSAVLGLGINQYRLYESGEMPSESIGKFLKCIETPSVFRLVLRNARGQFSDAEFKRIEARVKNTDSRVNEVCL